MRNGITYSISAGRDTRSGVALVTALIFISVCLLALRW